MDDIPDIYLVLFEVPNCESWAPQDGAGTEEQRQMEENSEGAIFV